MPRQYIKEDVWQLGRRRKKWIGDFWGTIASPAPSLIIDNIGKSFDKGLKKAKKEKEENQGEKKIQKPVSTKKVKQETIG